MTYSLAAASEKYAALLGKAEALNTRLREVERRHMEIANRIVARRNDAGTIIAAQRKPLSSRVRALLKAEPAAVEPPESPPTAADDEAADLAQLETMRDEEAALKEAIRLVREQLVQERLIASDVIVDQVRSEYDRRLAKVGEALIQLGHAQADLFALLAPLRAEGVAHARLPTPPICSVVGNPAHGGSNIRRGLAGMVKAGILPERAIPKKWGGQ